MSELILFFNPNEVNCCQHQYTTLCCIMTLADKNSLSIVTGGRVTKCFRGRELSGLFLLFPYNFA